MNFFAGSDEQSDYSKDHEKLPQVAPWPEAMMLFYEKQVLGFYVTSNPLSHCAEKIDAYICSRDKDMLQLLNEHVCTYNIKTDEKMTVEKMKEEMGLTPETFLRGNYRPRMSEARLEYVDLSLNERTAVLCAQQGLSKDGVLAAQVDAFAADQVILIGQVISRGGREDYSLSNELFSFEPFALALQRGDADFQLVADRVLSELNRSGRIGKIYKKWFGSFGEKPPAALNALYQLNSTPD